MEQESSIIQDLLTNPFSKCTLSVKKDIIRQGRPMPTLDLTQKAKNCVRRFNPDTYKKFDWLAGCSATNRLFCWPCLLFQSPNENKNVWINAGYADLGHLHTAGSRHNNSETHIQSSIAAKTFVTTKKLRTDNQSETSSDKMDTDTSKVIEDDDAEEEEEEPETLINAKQRAKIEEHNRKVDRNRQILRRLIDVICYITKLECSLRGKKEYGESENKGSYIEMLDMMSKYDQLLHNHFESKPMFMGKSNHIQNDLVSSVVGCMTNKIQSELDATHFVTIVLERCQPDIVDDHHSRLSIVFRYVNDSKTIERFLNFIDIPRTMTTEQKVDTISSIVIETVSKWKCETKLACQSYDAELISAEELCQIQQLVCNRFTTGLLVDSQSRVPNQILAQSLGSIRECRVFFAFIESVSRFLSNSTKKNSDFGKTIGRKIGSIPPSRWNNPSRQVNNVNENLESILAFFDEILDNFGLWSDEDVNSARGFQEYFYTFECRFLLKILAPVFELTDNLYNVMQKKSLDISNCQQQFCRTRNSIEEMKNDQRFENIFYSTITVVGQPVLRKSHGVYVDNPFLHLKVLYYQIYDNIASQLYVRFSQLEQLKYFELLDCGSFKKFAQSFPSELVSELKLSRYGGCFDLEKLKTQLRFVYSEQNCCFENQSLAEIVEYIDKNELGEIFTECLRLASLILTILPIERKYSVGKRINAYCQRNNAISTTMGQSRLNHLASIVIEKSLLTNLQQKDPDFYDNVIQIFNRLSSRRVELVYMTL